jgi:uncharacterized protein (TIGR02266 family)
MAKKRKSERGLQSGAEVAADAGDWPLPVDAPVTEAGSGEGDEAAKRRRPSAPSVMGFLSRVGGAPTLGKTPARGLLGRITQDDLRAVGRLADGQADGQAEALAPPATGLAPEETPSPAATVEVQVPEADGAQPKAQGPTAEGPDALPPGRADSRRGQQRRSDRFPFPVSVEYRAAGQPARHTADNLSATGMFIHTATPLEVGDAVIVNFSVPEAALPLTLGARIKWVTAAGTLDAPLSGMGLEFSALDDKKRRALALVVARLRVGSG